jgi:hypothetical protein
MGAHLAGQLLAIALASLVHAIVVRFGAKLFAKTVIAYGKAYTVALTANLTGFALGTVAAILRQHTEAHTVALLLVIAGVLASGPIYGKLLKREDGTSIGLDKGMAIMFLSLGIFAIPFLAIGMLGR